MTIVQVSRIQLREETAVRIRKAAETAKMLLSDYLEACVTLYEKYGPAPQPDNNDGETEKSSVIEAVSVVSTELVTEETATKEVEITTEKVEVATEESKPPPEEASTQTAIPPTRETVPEAPTGIPTKYTQKSLEAGFILALTLAGRDSPSKLSKQELADLTSVYAKAEAFAGSFKNFAYHIYQCWVEAYALLDREEHTTADFASYRDLSELVDCSRVDERTPENVSKELAGLRERF